MEKHFLCCLVAEEFVRKSPTNPMAFRLLAESLANTSRVSDALMMGKKALALDKNDTESMDLLAKLSIGAYKYKDGLEYIESLLKIKPGDQKTVQLKVSVLAGGHDARWRDGPQALKLATALCSGRDNDDSNLIALARAQAECGDFASAVQTATKAIRLTPANSKIRKFYEIELQLYTKNKPFRWPRLPPEDMGDHPERKDDKKK
jgi:cytochrome c-type biogenesis protein CcmH/NrfG